MIRYILFAFISLTCFKLSAQDLTKDITKGEQLYNEKKYDEAVLLLENSIQEYKGDIEGELITAHLWLGRNYMHSWRTTAASKVYTKAWELAQELGNDSLILEVGLSLTSILSFEKKSDSVKHITNILLEIPSLGHSERSDLYIELAAHYENKEKIDSAIYFASLAAAIDSTHQDSSSIPYTYFDLGNYYVVKFEYATGIEKILYGLNFLRGPRDVNKRINIEIGLSNIYFGIGNIIKAKELASAALLDAKKQELAVSETNAYNTLGNCAAYMNKYEDALQYYEKSDSVNEAKWKNKWRGVRAKASIIEQKLNLGQEIDETEVQSLITLFDGGESQAIKNTIEFILLRLRSYPPSEFAKEYARIFDQSGASDNLHLHQKLLKIKVKYLESKALYKQALEANDELEVIKKEINLKNNKYIIQDLEARHRKKEQALEIENLAMENARNEVTLEAQRNKILIGSIAMVLITLLSFFLFRVYQQVRKQKEIISKSLSEKDLLLREIHHRVKNNLQLVCSLLNLQGRSIDDETALQAINEGKSRVRSMALIHQDLYNRENITGISVKEYVEKLTSELFRSYRIGNEKVKLVLEVEDLEIDVDTLVPLGLILNELITNSLKYAFPTNNNGTLTISLKEEGDELVLKVIDDGIGYVADQSKESSFGSTLISALTEQLEGERQVNSANGTSVAIRIKKP